MKLLITVLYLLPNLWAQGPQRKALDVQKITYNPGGHKIGRFIVSYKDYEDIRIDSDWDGQIDQWYLRKGATEVQVRFQNGQASHLQIKHIGAKLVSLASYNKVGEKFLLESATQRAPILMNLSEEEAKCEIESIKAKMQSHNKQIEDEIIKDIIGEKLISSECKDNLSRKELAQVKKGLQSSLSEGSDLNNCFKNKNFIEAANQNKSLKISPELLVARFQLQTAQLTHQADDNAPLLRCEKAPGQTSALSTTEERKIHLNPSKAKENKAFIDKQDFEHELLHRSGLESEDEVKAVETICKLISIKQNLNNGTTKSFGHVISNETIAKNIASVENESTANLNTGGNKSPAASAEPKKGVEVAKTSTADSSPARAPAATGNQLAASQATANIPKEMTVAQTGIPAAPTLSQSITNPPPATEAGAQQAVVQSASESGGVLRMANNLVGAMNSRAVASDSLASNDSNTSSKSEVSSGTKTKSTESNRTKSDAFATFSRNKVGSDERIVEQITLDGNNIQPSTARSASQEVVSSKAPQPAGSREPAAAKGAAQNEVARSTSSGGSFSGGGGSGFDSSTPAMAGGGSSPSRAPAAVNPSIEAKARPATQKTEPTPSTGTKDTTRDEVVTFISNGSYRNTKEKLQKPEFRKQLESQKITVLDLYGNSVGATKGEVIFLDQGDKFVRQK